MRIIYLLLWRTEEKNIDSTYFVDVRSQCRIGHFLFVGGGHLIWIIVKVCQILLLFVLWQFRTLQGPFSSCFFFYVSASWFFFFKYIHVSLSVKRFTFDHKSLSNCSTVILTHEFLAGLDDIGLYLPLDYNKRICFDWCDFRSFLIFLSPIVCSGTPPVRVRLVHNLAAWRYFCGYGYSRWPFFASPLVLLQVVASDGVRAMMESALTARDRVGVQDFVLLENYTSEAAFIENLRKRFKENLIYVSSCGMRSQSVRWIFLYILTMWVHAWYTSTTPLLPKSLKSPEIFLYRVTILKFHGGCNS